MRKNILIFLIWICALFLSLLLGGCGFKDETPIVAAKTETVLAASPAPTPATVETIKEKTPENVEIKKELPFKILINDVNAEFQKNQNGNFENKILISNLKSFSIEPHDELYLKYQIAYKLKTSDDDLVKVLDEEVLENQKKNILIKLPDPSEIKNIKFMLINFERIYSEKENIKFTIYLEDTNND